MDLRIIGCHGGESPKHRSSGFLLQTAAASLAIDAGSLASGLTLQEQCALLGVCISHAHLDHIKDLAAIADNRLQGNSKPLLITGTQATLSILKNHFFNGLIWPDFTKLPSEEHPTIVYQLLEPEVPFQFDQFEIRAVPVHHTIDTNGFVIQASGASSIAYSGDTGPTDRFWQILNQTPDLKAVLVEVSFPNSQQTIATLSGHHTPQTVEADIRKYLRYRDVPMLVYHLKPTFESEIQRELANLKSELNLTVVHIEDEFVL